MKTLPFALWAALSVTASAQRKLWTWESPLKDETVYVGNINGAAVDSKGYTALLIGEWVVNENAPPTVSRHRVLWISPKGKVLHEEVINRPNEALHFIVDGFDTWKILHVSQSSMAYTDGDRICTVKLKGKLKNTASVALDDFASAFSPSPSASFAGWLQQTGEQKWEYPAVGRIFTIQTPKTISLWSIK